MLVVTRLKIDYDFYEMSVKKCMVVICPYDFPPHASIYVMTWFPRLVRQDSRRVLNVGGLQPQT